MIWQVSAGLPAPLVNVPVFSTEGYLIGIPDLLSQEASLAVEYDGEDHLDFERRQADVRRDARFAIHGLRTLRVSQVDTADGIADLIRRLRDAYEAGLERDRSADRWTLVAPPDWVPAE